MYLNKHSLDFKMRRRVRPPLNPDLSDLSEISRGGGGESGGGNFKFGFGNAVTDPCNGSEIC